LILSLLVLNVVPSARADIQEPTSSHGGGAREQRREKPAGGVPQTADVNLGGTAEITLRAHGQNGKWINFFIRSQPEHGSLTGPPIQLTRTTASVTYVHHAQDGPGTDSFTFSVQAAGSEVSAPVTVTVNVRDTPPSLVVTPSELDFGAVKVGDTSGVDLVLENQGGGEAVGTLSPPPPWTVDGPAEYKLARGQSQSFHLLFIPRFGHSYSETLLLPAGGSQAHLVGTGLGGPAGPDPFVSTLASTLPADASADAGANGAGSGAGAPGGAAEMAPAPTPAPAAPEAPPPRLANQGSSADPMKGMQSPLDDTGTATGQAASAPLDTFGYITPYDTGVKELKLRSAGRTTLDISWKPMTPSPRIYRVELRYLTVDSNDKLRIDWRPYAQVDMRLSKDLCIATVRGLPSQTRETLRVVAIDFSGRVAGASATLQAFTLSPSSFWRITPLRVLFALLLLCFGLAWRRRWEERQILREIDESRAASRETLYRS
jgi:hypothetical protein